jgi:hypothetical protein
MIREPYFLPRISQQNYKTIRGLDGSDLPPRRRRRTGVASVGPAGSSLRQSPWTS